MSPEILFAIPKPPEPPPQISSNFSLAQFFRWEREGFIGRKPLILDARQCGIIKRALDLRQQLDDPEQAAIRSGSKVLSRFQAGATLFNMAGAVISFTGPDVAEILLTPLEIIKQADPLGYPLSRFYSELQA